MLVITSRKEVGNFLGFPVFQVTSMKFVPCDQALKRSTSQEVSFFFYAWIIICFSSLFLMVKSHLNPCNHFF